MSWLLNSTLAVVVGLPMVLGAILLIYFNEGRSDTSNAARSAVADEPTRPDPSLDGKPVSLTGMLVTTEIVGDGLYLKPANYLAVHRTVEMYAWTEHAEYQGRSSDATYTYAKDWFKSPTPTAGFNQPEGHLNPPMAVQSADFHPTFAKLGAYTLDLNNLELPGSTPLSLTADNTNLSPGSELVGVQSIYVGRSGYSNPEIGDLLIRYEVVPSGISVTAYGTPHGSVLQRYVDGSGNSLYGVYLGTPADAVEEMHGSYVTTLWFLRCTGFFLLWAGTYLVIRPLVGVLGAMPILGEMAGASVAATTFFGALSLTILTILISVILHSVFAPLLVAIFGVTIASRQLPPIRRIVNARQGRTRYWGKGFRK